MQSPPSTTASPTGIKESLSLAAKAQAGVDKRRSLAPKPAEPKPVAKSTPKIPNLLSDEDREKLRADSERREAARRYSDIIYRSDLPKRHMEAEVSDTGKWAEAKIRACDAIAFKQGVLLSGLRGTGKTQIAVACGRKSAELGRSVKYMQASELYRACREAMQDNRESARIKEFQRIGLLIVDEAHVRGETDYEDRTLTEIVNGRYMQSLPTILITNQGTDAAAKALGPSIVSRFHESGIVIECNWTSYRKKSDDRPHTTRHA